MKSRIAPIILAGSIGIIGATAVKAQDAGALVDKLVSKGVLSTQEAEEVRAEMTRDFAKTSAGKINISPSITELKLYGQFRYRWQYDDREAQIASSNHVDQRSRHRFRLTLGADVKLGDQFYAGFALETGQSAKAGVQTFENGFDDYGIFINKAFLGWKPNDWLDATIGKVKNPFYTTDMVWDPDITPNGLFETVAFHKMPIFDGEGGPTGDPSKDGKAVAEKKSSSWELTLVAGQMIFDDNNEFALDNDLSTDAYLFVEQLIATYKFNKDTSITLAPAFMSWTAADLSGLLSENAFTDAGIINPSLTTTTTTSTVNTIQDTVSANGLTTTRVTTPTTVVQVVTTQTNPDGTRTVLTTQTTTRPGSPNTKLLTTVGGVPNSQTTTASTVASASVASPVVPGRGGLAAISGETRSMHILTAPGDISFKLGGLKTKVYWDFAYNFTGRERYDSIYQLRSNPRSYETRDSLAWLVGLQFGGIKKKGDWEAYINYRETGIASVDSNLNDKDFALSELNMRGFKLALSYALSDSVVFSVKGYMAWNLDSNLTGGRATNSAQAAPLAVAGIAESNAVNVVQVDLAVKF